MTRRWALPLLLIAFGLFYLLPMATHGLWIPDETRYAQISQEMLHGGQWASPHFMGIRYFEKPVAGYWLMAIGQAVFGDNLFGVRVASALSTGLNVVLAYLLAMRLWNDSRKAVASALLYMSFTVVALLAGYANLDPQFTFWVNLSLVALWFTFDCKTSRGQLLAWVVLGLACGMGFMTKGFLAWLLPVLVALPYAIWQKRLRSLLVFGGIGVFVAVVISLPWALAVHAQEPDYWRFFFWHEHIRRFAGEDAQHASPWWYYLPLLVAFSVPWVMLLPATFMQAWHQRRLGSSGFLLLWLVLPLAFFSLSKGKLPAYILPCLLPLALLMGNALMDRLSNKQTRLISLNGLLNLLAGLLGLLALVYFQLKKPVYVDEPQHLVLVYVLLLGWIFSNLLAAMRPSNMWAAPALGSFLLVALAPAALPNSVVYNKIPDQFIIDHVAELNQAKALLSNDLGTASALAWRLRRNDVTLYNTKGELKYGLGYADSVQRQVELDQVQSWIAEARKQGSVGVAMRVKDDDEDHEVDRLPKDAKRYQQGNIVIFIIPQDQP